LSVTKYVNNWLVLVTPVTLEANIGSHLLYV
jgi:hypothetical protein